MSEKISVIVPIFKVEEYLDECVQSLLGQTYKNLEIILVDDGSPDACGPMCDRYAEIDKRVRVIHKENGGLSDARNAGIAAATGDYLAFVDSDDYIDYRFIEYLLELAHKYEADIAECYSVSFREGETLTGVMIEEEHLYTPKEWITQTSLKQFLSCVAWNKIYRRELFEGITYPVGRHYEDEATTYRVVYNANRIARGRSELYFYRQRDNSITSAEKNMGETRQKFQALYEKCVFFATQEEPELEAFSYSKLMIFMLSVVDIWNQDGFEERKAWRTIIKSNIVKILCSTVVPMKYKLFIIVKSLAI